MNKYFLILFFLFNITIAQNQSEINDKSNENDLGQVKTTILPFAFYNNSQGIVVGGFMGMKSFVQKETFLKIGAMISEKKTYYGFIQLESFQLPLFPRIFIRPDIYVGKVKELELYLGETESDYISPGGNYSTPKNKVVLEGFDQWYEVNIKYLLPIGDGKDKPIINPKFNIGQLVSGETGGTHWNPLKSGRSFVESKLIYRHMDFENDDLIFNTKTLALELSLTHENVDYYFNPSIGSIKRLSYSFDWGAVGSENKFDAVKIDCRIYIPLNDTKANNLPCVLAFNFITMDTPSWNKYDLITDSEGNQTKIFHRPQLFVSANLGGVKKLRAYNAFRFYDRSMIYYSAEIRKTLEWNPLNYFSLTKSIGVDFFQLVGFADIGRVAPHWKINTLHTDMKWSIGGGLRAYMGGLVARVDVAKGKDDIMVQMFIDHPF